MEIKQCTRCILDNRIDANMSFDSEGRCNYCTDALNRMKTTYFPNTEGQKKLEALIKDIKKKGEGKKYDCVMGLSGGLDSSYLAYLGYKWGLRVLAIHIDDGFDTAISKENLKRLISATGYDYEVVTPDAKQYNALTKAYMKAGVPNLCAPQDSVLFAFLYDQMKKDRVNCFVSGWNFAGECIMQGDLIRTAYDSRNIKEIHKKYGTEPINKLKLADYRRIYLDKKIYGHSMPTPLNYINYERDKAFKELGEFCDFQYYGRKHLENILTAFLQLFWLPQKFGFDKRTSHYSSMVISGQMSRENAIQAMKEPLYEEELMREYIEVIKDKLEISDTEFEKIMKEPAHLHSEFKSNTDEWFYKIRHIGRK